MASFEIHIGLLKGIKREDLIPDYYKRNELKESTSIRIHDIETKLTANELEILKNIAAQAYQKSRTANEDEKWQGIASTYTKLLDLAKFMKSDTSLEVSSLDTLEIALKKYIATSPVRWMFLELPDKTLVPHLIDGISYKSGSRDEHPRVILSMTFENYKGEIESKNFNFYKDDFKNMFEDEDESEDHDEESKMKRKKKGTNGVKVSTLCAFKKLHLGTEDLYEKYKKQIEFYQKLKSTTGILLTAEPNAIGCYSSNVTNWKDEYTFNKYSITGNEDRKSTLITDENDEEKITMNNWYSWYTNEKYSGQTSLWGASFKPIIPIHPRVKCFDFSMQSHCMMHVDYLQLKKFDEDLRGKLILPKKDKIFIDMLMESSKIKMNDIISGKAGGMTILSTGTPGTGKTLTAEVYAESVKKPLYSVQCSELGVDPEKLETSLKKVLRRAERWKALLMLDEADVYIRARGEDIKQNAIVGVFLRVLEYYSGILFMTTNKLESNIDDAIISRCTAHLRYKNLTGDLLKQGWEVLSEQFEVKLTKKDIDILCDKWPNLSGRSIKNLLKLTRKYASATKEKPDSVMVETVSEYSPAFKND